MKTYGKLSALAHDLEMPRASDDSLEFFEKYLRNANGRILEAMCGTGAFLLPFLQKGYDIEGLDRSADMAALCKSKAKELGLDPVVHCQSFPEFSIDSRYRLIYIASGSFTRLYDDAVISRSLTCMHKHLEPGGTLVIEIDSLAAKPSDHGEWKVQWQTLSNTELIVHNRANQGFDDKKRHFKYLVKYEHIRDGGLVATEFREVTQRLYEKIEFQKMLEISSFTDIKHFVKRTPGALQEMTMVFECKRPK